MLPPMCHFLHVGHITLKHIKVLKYQPTYRNNIFRSLYRKSETAILSSLPFLNQIPLVHGTITVWTTIKHCVELLKEGFLEAWQSTHSLKAKNGIGEIRVF